MLLGKKIKELRMKMNLSCSELARQSGHSVSTIHNLEQGNSLNPGFILVRDISKVLNIKLDDLSEYL